MDEHRHRELEKAIVDIRGDYREIRTDINWIKKSLNGKNWRTIVMTLMGLGYLIGTIIIFTRSFK